MSENLYPATGPPVHSKSNTCVLHTGVSPSIPSPFATTLKNIQVNKDIWNSGVCVYHINKPQHCLPPAYDKSDRVLRFDSQFESGNLYSAFQMSHDSYHAILEFDKNASGSCQWFYFKIMNVKSSIKYTFYLSGFHKVSGVFHSGYRVFWYSEALSKHKNISWARGGYNYSYGVTKKDHTGKRSTLQFSIQFPYDDDSVYIAYSLPYTYTYLMKQISLWSHHFNRVFQSEIFCQSYGGKDCPIITITNPRSLIPYEKKEYIFITARIHPGETNGSIVLHGMIDFLLSKCMYSTFLLDNYIIKIIPMVCIDGVIEGHYRISLSGYDLNRIWSEPDPLLHPVVFRIKEMMKQVTQYSRIAFYLDFHGHSRLHSTFAYGCPPEPNSELVGTEKLFPKVISSISDDFSWARCVFSFPEGRKASSRIVIRKELGVSYSYTIESSFGGVTSGPHIGTLYNEARWKNIGQKTGEAMAIVLSGKHKEIISRFSTKPTMAKKFPKSSLVLLSASKEENKQKSIIIARKTIVSSGSSTRMFIRKTESYSKFNHDL